MVVALQVDELGRESKYREAMLLQQEYVCWRAEVRLDPDPRHYLMLARWEEMARLHCGSMLNAQIEAEIEASLERSEK